MSVPEVISEIKLLISKTNQQLVNAKNVGDELYCEGKIKAYKECLELLKDK